MAATVQLFGTTQIGISLATSGSIALLGLSINGVEIEEQSFSEDIHGDQNGGEAGPPIEVVQHGEMHRIRMTLSKWDQTVANLIRANISGGSAGVPAPAGSLLFAGGSAFRLLLNNASYPRNYPIVAFFKEPRSINMGSRASQLVLVGTAYKNGSGVLWDSTITSTYAYSAPS